MKKQLAGALLGLALLVGQNALAADDNERINPDYICAQYLALASTSPSGPLFQALQIDGFVSAELGMTWADPDTIKGLMQAVYGMCEAHPTEPVAVHWEQARRIIEDPVEKNWDADTTRCRQLNENPDDGSGFIVWLDAYNRQYSVTKKSILNSDKDIQNFIDACKQRPDDRMIDVLRDSLPK